MRRIRLRPLTQGEILRLKPGFLDRAIEGKFGKPKTELGRDDVLEIGFRGGFLEAVKSEFIFLSVLSAIRWLSR